MRDDGPVPAPFGDDGLAGVVARVHIHVGQVACARHSGRVSSSRRAHCCSASGSSYAGRLLGASSTEAGRQGGRVAPSGARGRMSSWARRISGSATHPAGCRTRRSRCCPEAGRAATRRCRACQSEAPHWPCTPPALKLQGGRDVVHLQWVSLLSSPARSAGPARCSRETSHVTRLGHPQMQSTHPFGATCNEGSARCPLPLRGLQPGSLLAVRRRLPPPLAGARPPISRQRASIGRRRALFSDTHLEPLVEGGVLGVRREVPFEQQAHGVSFHSQQGLHAHPDVSQSHAGHHQPSGGAGGEASVLAQLPPLGLESPDEDIAAWQERDGACAGVRGRGQGYLHGQG